MDNDSFWNNDPLWYMSKPQCHLTSDAMGTLRITQLIKVYKPAMASVIDLDDHGNVSDISGWKCVKSEL